jgi:hypothetical protein
LSSQDVTTATTASDVRLAGMMIDEIVALIRKVGYEAITLAAPF